MEKHIKLIKTYSREKYNNITKPPANRLAFPYIVPGSDSYMTQLWDWDSWLTDIGIVQIMKDNNICSDYYLECEKGCIRNFALSSLDDGRMPIMVSPSSTIPSFESNEISNIHKPCFAQHIAFILKNNQDDREWLMPVIPKAEAFLDYYFKNLRHNESGLYFWYDDIAIGVDNDPCTFYRPKCSSASIFLNCLMYKELRAMEYICGALDLDSSKYANEANRLKLAINEHLWDERNGFYYSADLNLLPVDPTQKMHSGMPRHWSCLIQRIDVWSGFTAMWAGIADADKAKRMVYENMLEKKTFNAEYGIRTLSKLEKMYCVVKSGNPSCWLGPVWGISNYMCFKGLLNYGYEEEARILAEKTILLHGKSLEKCGHMHEYYDPDSGAGVNNPGFQSWNLLVNNMIAYLEGKETISEF